MNGDLSSISEHQGNQASYSVLGMAKSIPAVSWSHRHRHPRSSVAPVAQKVHPIWQPTCEDTHSVDLVLTTSSSPHSSPSLEHDTAQDAVGFGVRSHALVNGVEQ